MTRSFDSKGKREFPPTLNRLFEKSKDFLNRNGCVNCCCFARCCAADCYGWPSVFGWGGPELVLGAIGNDCRSRISASADRVKKFEGVQDYRILTGAFCPLGTSDVYFRVFIFSCQSCFAAASDSGCSIRSRVLTDKICAA